MLREHILSVPPSSSTIHAISSLLALVRKGYTEDELAHQYAISIGKDHAWKSDVTYKGFTEFGLSYLTELGLLDPGIEIEHSGPIQRDGAPPTHEKKTILFTWNPRKWQWDDLAQAVYEVNVEGRHLDEWSCGRTRDIAAGDRAFLMRLGEAPKGIIGSGVVVSTPREGLHWNRERADLGETVYRVEVLFDVLSETPLIYENALADEVLGRHKWFPQASGTQIPDDIAKHLEKVWSRATGTAFDPPEPADIPTVRAEGTKRSRLITQYERNPKAREECIRHHGRMCQVCGLVFEKHYGPIGNRFIHVHHIVPISDVGGAYEVDPVKDLCPVCPNCHAMLHKRTPPFGILELKAIVEDFQSTGSSGQRKMPR
ncbi:MAG: hypothetical protein E4H32_10485 [Nitrospirales bacterium]|nr:MAG: hypothetical protein E4H32_10485 [Nitrospirales bacterium]